MMDARKKSASDIRHLVFRFSEGRRQVFALMNISNLAVAALACTSFLVHADGADRHLHVLAASCAACHGTDGNSVGGTPVLSGLDAAHFKLQMQAFRSGERSSTVMHHHAKGLTEAEIEALADYFAAQPRIAATSPNPLNL
jgi:cytochrome c553